MTDRVNTLTVHLDGDYRTDDAQAIVDAIKMVRGVNGVSLGKPVDANEHSYRMTLRAKIYKAMMESLDDILLNRKF